MSAHRRNDRTFRPENVERLDDPARALSLPPAEVIEALRLAAGMTVADIGAGTGYFAIPLARALGPGRVLAIDFQEEMLRLLRQRLAAEDAPRNVEIVSGEAHATNVGTGSCDRVLIANVWHELDRRSEALTEMRRIIGARGELAILDWRADVEPPPGPPQSHRVAMNEVIAELESERWAVAQGRLTGSFSYLVMAEPR